MSAILPVRQGPQINMQSQEPKSSQELVKDLINFKLIEASRNKQEMIIDVAQQSAVVPAKGLDPNSQQQNTIP